MKAVYFFEKDGIRHYKCDTFWTKSRNIQYAKIHDDSDFDKKRFLKSGLIELTINLSDGSSVEFFNNAIYGYQTLENGTYSNPIYLWIIKNIKDDGSYDIIDWKLFKRDQTLNNILDF